MVQGEFTPEARLSQHIKDVRLILAEAKRGDVTATVFDDSSGASGTGRSRWFWRTGQQRDHSDHRGPKPSADCGATISSAKFSDAVSNSLRLRPDFLRLPCIEG